MEADEIDMALEELDNRLERLRALYEQYFLGIEKIEPSVARKDVDRRFWILRRTQIRNTARRFRLQTLVQRYNTFQQYWSRICREIENGTYHRHLIKVQKAFAEEPKTWAARKRFGRARDPLAAGDGQPEPAPTTHQLPEDLDTLPDTFGQGAETEHAPLPPLSAARGRADLGRLELDLDDDAPPPQRPRPVPAAAPPPQKAAPPAPPAGPIRRPSSMGIRKPSRPSIPKPRLPTPGAPRAAVPAPPGPQEGLSDDRVRQLHGELLAARRKLQQSEAVTLDSLAKTLRDTERKLRAEHGARAIDFQITVRDGKPVVKPIVRK